MSGLYIHIPFCKQACYYCDFHFSTNLEKKKQLVEAICREIYLQKEYLGKQPVLETIYFGGGTPSLLNENEFESIFETIYKYYAVSVNPEVTLESNPDDLTVAKLHSLKKFSFNRLSIGIQSFNDSHLTYLNRPHTATHAKQCIREAQNAGFSNINIDLIYAIPNIDHHIWENDLKTSIDLKIQHISAYCLTIEPQTAFGKWVQKGKIKPIDEEFSIQQFVKLIEILEKNGFEQYEISNFAVPGYYSRHNTGYWKKQNYLGIGPSAHSYNGKTRQYNIANNINYIKSIEKNNIPCTIETLSTTDQVNEYIMTSLRTKWGCNLQEISRFSGIDIKKVNKNYLRDFLFQELITIENDVMKLTSKGKLLADKIASDLFII